MDDSEVVPNLKEIDGIPIEIELPDELKDKYVVM
jgi:hypothetical protein